MTNRYDRYFLPATLLLTFGLSLLRFQSIPVGTFFDDAHYLILAESLVNGDGYRLINFRAMPVEQAFPAGWPLLLAPLAWLLPGNLVVPKLLTLAFSLGSVWLADKLFRERLNGWERPLVLLLTGTNPLFVGAAGTVMSEPAYLFFSLLVLVLLEKMGERSRFDLRSIGRVGLILGLAFFGMLIRTVGVSLLIAAVIGLIPQKNRGKFAAGGITLAAVGGVGLWLFSSFLPDLFLLSPTYAGHVEYLSSELGYYLRFWELLPWFDWPAIGSVIVPLLDLNLSFIPLFDTLKSAGGVLLILLVLAGWVLTMRDDMRPSEIYFLLFLGIFYFWTAYIGEVQARQLIPMIPFATFYLVRLMSWLGKALGNRGWVLGSRVGTAFCVLLVGIMLARNGFEWANPVRERVVDHAVGGHWIRENTEPDAVYAVNYPHPSYLYARRSTEYLPVGMMGADFDRYAAERNLSYLLIQPDLADWHTGEFTVRPEIADELVPYLLQNTAEYRLVFEDEANQVVIFEVVRE